MLIGRSSLLSLVALPLVALAIGAGCAPPEQTEARGYTTSKLLAPYKAVQTPASVTADFVAALGGVPVDIDGWQGYVAGTIEGTKKDDALFAIHLSGVRGEAAVAGLTIAFVEDAAATGDLGDRLEHASTLEVRFNNGTGLVAKHSFATGVSTAAHQTDPATDSLLKRAFNDAEAMLQASAAHASSSEESTSCLASYLETVASAARCVNDAANAKDCSSSRASALAVAATCAGAETANVLATTARSGGIRAQGFDLGSLFKMFFGLVSPRPPAAPATIGAQGMLGNGGILGLITRLFSGASSFAPTTFGQPTTAKRIVASSDSGRVSVVPKSNASSSAGPRGPSSCGAGFRLICASVSFGKCVENACLREATPAAVPPAPAAVPNEEEGDPEEEGV